MHGIYDGASMRGKLVSIEGIDGCGKTTHTRLLAEWLRSQGYRVVVTDEPTDGIIGRIIKRALKGEIKIQVPTEALLFAADRVQHVDEVIRPALKAGRIVITERYFYSSLAYQSARGLSMHWLESINRAALKPNLSILIDLPSDDALQRIKGGERQLFKNFICCLLDALAMLTESVHPDDVDVALEHVDEAGIA
jgi:dTMP kinase